jgi:hypothetical protein
MLDEEGQSGMVKDQHHNLEVTFSTTNYTTHSNPSLLEQNDQVAKGAKLTGQYAILK